MSPLMDKYSHEIRLKEGLVGAHMRQYNHSATFKHSIDTLAQMLPLWVDGIAAKCAENDARQEERMIELMMQPLAARRIDPTEWRTHEH